jgi:hypothetical protein
VNESNAQLIRTELLSSDKAVYIVDMAENKRPSIAAGSVGFTVLSSSPRPFKKHVERVRAYKAGTVLYSPTPWSKKEIKVVFDYASSNLRGDDSKLGIQTWAREVKKPFEFYFNLFGGTLRALHYPEEEMRRMAQAVTELEKTPPDQNFLDLVLKGVESMVEDFTHTLFTEEGGAKKRPIS